DRQLSMNRKARIEYIRENPKAFGNPLTNLLDTDERIVDEASARIALLGQEVIHGPFAPRPYPADLFQGFLPLPNVVNGPDVVCSIVTRSDRLETDQIRINGDWCGVSGRWIENFGIQLIHELDLGIEYIGHFRHISNRTNPGSEQPRGADGGRIGKVA